MNITINESYYQDDKEIWITSDLHFWHKNILNFNPKYRPYKDVEEMNNQLIKHWNSKVGLNDTVFHLGDFSFGKLEQTESILKCLKGNIVFIKGNHDYSDFEKVVNKLNFKIYDYAHLKLDKSLKLQWDLNPKVNQKAILFHFPILYWDGMEHGSYHLHGHMHGTLPPEERRLDVGYDSLGEIGNFKDIILKLNKLNYSKRPQGING